MLSLPARPKDGQDPMIRFVALSVFWPTFRFDTVLSRIYKLRSRPRNDALWGTLSAGFFLLFDIVVEKEGMRGRRRCLVIGVLSFVYPVLVRF